MILLGIETSGPIGSIALRQDGRCLEECVLPELSRRHAQSLVPSVQEFLRRQRLLLRDIDAVAVSIGPGSFTGLRVGVTFAKTLAYAANTTLIAVDTFVSIAENTPAATSVTVIADAQQRGLMVGLYKRSLGTRFHRQDEIRIITRQEALTYLPSAPLISGSGFERLPELALNTNQIVPATLRYSRASTIARLGEELLSQEITSDVTSLEPVYIRKSAAEEKKRGK